MIEDYLREGKELTYDELLAAVKEDRGAAFDLAQLNREIVQLTGSGKATIKAGRLVLRSNMETQRDELRKKMGLGDDT